jgi:hypothetical protein
LHFLLAVNQSIAAQICPAAWVDRYRVILPPFVFRGRVYHRVALKISPGTITHLNGIPSRIYNLVPFDLDIGQLVISGVTWPYVNPFVLAKAN